MKSTMNTGVSSAETGRAPAVVIGAGPAGSITARELLRAGLGPVALLDRAEFPRVKPCAGGLSPACQRVLDKLGLYDRVAAEAHPILGALLQAPSGRAVRFEGGQGTLVLRRDLLDALLAEEAVALGADFHQGIRVTRITPLAGGDLEVHAGDGRAFRARHVVVATGASGGALPGTPLPPGTLVTMTGWYRGVTSEPNVAEMYFDPELAPHYGWLFPEGEGRVNIGLCLDGRQRAGLRVTECFNRFLARHFAGRMGGATLLGPLRGHPIAASGWVPTPKVLPGVLVVGEAARLANRITGEGIYHALVSGRLAAQAILHASARGRSPEEARRWHLQALRRRLGPGLLLADRLAGLAGPAMNLAAWIRPVPPGPGRLWDACSEASDHLSMPLCCISVQHAPRRGTPSVGMGRGQGDPVLRCLSR